MNFGLRIGLQLCKSLVRSYAGVSRRCISGTAFQLQNGANGGKGDSDWKLYPIDPSEEVQQEPWLKSAMNTLNRELMRQGVRIRGKPVDPSLIPKSPAAEYEKFFEQHFLPCSHGFRPGLSQHTCLKQIRRDFQGTVWYIEGKSLSRYFNQIQPETVERMLADKVQFRSSRSLDKHLLTSLKASARRGITRDGFDPLASNLVLHELDTFLMRLKSKVDRGRRQTATPAIFNVARTALALDRTAYRLVTQNKRTISLSPPQDPYLRRLTYTRFADDFLIGIIGPRALAVRIQELVQRFLKVKLGMQADPENFEISRAKDSKVPFLGYLISRNPDRVRKFCRRQGNNWITYRVQDYGTLCFLVDMRKVIRRLAEKGFCDKSGKPKPNFRYYQYPQEKSVQAVGNILRGLADYYHLSDSKRQCVNRLSYILRSSLAKAYAAKFKLGSSAKVYKRGGKDLSRPIKVKGGSPPRNASVKKGGEKPQRPPRRAAFPFTKYREISHPDRMGLTRDWERRPLRSRFLSR